MPICLIFFAFITDDNHLLTLTLDKNRGVDKGHGFTPFACFWVLMRGLILEGVDLYRKSGEISSPAARITFFTNDFTG